MPAKFCSPNAPTDATNYDSRVDVTTVDHAINISNLQSLGTSEKFDARWGDCKLNSGTFMICKNAASLTPGPVAPSKTDLSPFLI